MVSLLSFAAHFDDGFFEGITANFIEDSSLNDFRSLENSFKHIVLKLKSNASKYFIYFSFWSR